MYLNAPIKDTQGTRLAACHTNVKQSICKNLLINCIRCIPVENTFSSSCAVQLFQIDREYVKRTSDWNRFRYHVLLCRSLSTWKGGNHCERPRKLNNTELRCLHGNRKIDRLCCKNQVAMNPSNTVFGELWAQPGEWTMEELWFNFRFYFCRREATDWSEIWRS